MFSVYFSTVTSSGADHNENIDGELLYKRRKNLSGVPERLKLKQAPMIPCDATFDLLGCSTIVHVLPVFFLSFFRSYNLPERASVACQRYVKRCADTSEKSETLLQLSTPSYHIYSAFAAFLRGSCALQIALIIIITIIII